MRTTTQILFISALTLAGCGGGGGNNRTNVPAPSVSISSANAVQVADAAVATTNVDDSVSLGTDALTTPVALAGGSARAAAQAARSLARARAQDRETIDCDLAPGASTPGNVDLTTDDADNNGDVSINDSVNLVFNNCYSSQDGESVSGRIFARVTSVGNNDDIGLAFQFDNLAATGPEDSSINGSTNVSVSFPSVDTTRIVLNGGSFTATDDSDTVTVINPQLTFTQNDNTGAYSIFGTSTITSNDLGGTIAIEIPQNTPLEGVGDGDPTEGSMNITGVNSNMVLTVTAPNQVKLDIDTSGDRVADQSRTVTWDEITL